MTDKLNRGVVEILTPIGPRGGSAAAAAAVGSDYGRSGDSALRCRRSTEIVALLKEFSNFSCLRDLCRIRQRS